MRITGFDPIVAASLTANDVLLIESLGLGLTKKLTLQNLAIYLFGGTLATGIFVTLSGSQTLENKRLNSPKINSANGTAATSAELDILHGATLSTAELNLLTGKTSLVDLASIQTVQNKLLLNCQLSQWFVYNGTSWVQCTAKAEEINFLSNLDENLRLWMNGVENQLQDLANIDIRLFTLSFGAAASTYELLESVIQAALSTTRKVDISSVIWYGNDDGSGKIKMQNPADIQVRTQTTLGTVHLEKYVLTVTSGQAYFVSIQCRLI